MSNEFLIIFTIILIVVGGLAGLTIACGGMHSAFCFCEKKFGFFCKNKEEKA